MIHAMSERSTRAISSVLSVSFIHHFILRVFHYFARFSCHVSPRTRRRIQIDPVTAFRRPREQGWLSLARVAFNQNVRVALSSPLHRLGHTWNQYCWKRETDSGAQLVGILGQLRASHGLSADLGSSPSITHQKFPTYAASRQCSLCSAPPPSASRCLIGDSLNPALLPNPAHCLDLMI